jgi:hypothetical protein
MRGEGVLHDGFIHLHTFVGLVDLIDPSRVFLTSILIPPKMQ